MSKHFDITKRVPIEDNNPSIIRDDSLCKNCTICVRACKNQMGVLGHYDLEAVGDVAACIHCGQCAAQCPFNAITERYNINEVFDALNDENKIVVVSTAPAVRAALGEEFDMEDGTNVEGKMVTLLKKLGFNYVLDTCVSADMTIIEEANELVERIKNKGVLPQFTSCCPAWVKFTEMFYPNLIPNLSTAKSPIAMQGALIKSFFANKEGIDSKKIVNVTIAPCTAKKYEITRPELNYSDEYKDNDYILTTRELAMMAKMKNIDFVNLEDSKYDSILGDASGAGIIFGNTGGVMEAALRTSYTILTGKPAPKDLLSYEPIRGLTDVKEATVNINGLNINVAVIFGTQKAREFIEALPTLNKEYHFIEVMACPGGCISGGGQPKGTIKKRDELRLKRISALYSIDERKAVRQSDQNEQCKIIYKEMLDKPLSDAAEKMLHTKFDDKSKLVK